MKNLLADANWLIRLEREIATRRDGLAVALCRQARVHVCPISQAEFLSKGTNAARQAALSRMFLTPNVDFQDANRAAALRLQRAKHGKPLGTPDAFMAALALRHKMQLVTADKDFSGIPGLDWSSYSKPA